MSALEPTTQEALAQAKALKSANDLDSHFGHLYASPKGRNLGEWNIRIRGDNNTSQVYAKHARKGTKILATVRTRNKRAVVEMMNSLEVFHKAGGL